MNLVLQVVLTVLLLASRGRPIHHYSPYPVPKLSEQTYYQTPFSQPVQTERDPVCVVGAGISGLSLGILLKAKGYHVEIFEEKDRVGGKAETYREGNSTVQIETGPISITKSDLYLLEYINRFNYTLNPFNYRDDRAYDPETGSIQAVPGFIGDSSTPFVTALQRYREYHASYKKALEFGYWNATPDLFVPFSTWLALRNLTILTPFLMVPVTLSGYGHLDDTPALFALKQASPLLPRFSDNETYYMLKEGLGALMNRMAEGLNVKLSHRVVKIVRRHSGLQELHFEDSGQPMRRCTRVILAFPPLLSKLEKVVADLTSAEKDVLRHVKIEKYTSAGHHLPPLDHAVYYEGITHPDPRQAPVILRSPEGRSEVIALIRQENGDLKNTYSSYSWIRGDYDSGPTEADLDKIRSNIGQFVQKISPNPTTFFTRATEYFPHVTTKSLQEGFYHNFDRLQGRDGLYYATTLLTFETMNFALEMTEAVVQKYF